MILESKRSGYNPFVRDYSLTMDESEYKQALEGKPIYRAVVSSNIAGEFTVSFKKFSRAKMKRMNLIQNRSGEMKNKKKRYFIVAPQHELDFLYQVCSTHSRGSFFEIYANDEYYEEASFDDEDCKVSLKKCISFCRRKGCKRVTQI